MAFVTPDMIDLCIDYDILVDECLQNNQDCDGWNSNNYATNELLKKCLIEMTIEEVIESMKRLCTLTNSEPIDICKKL